MLPRQTNDSELAQARAALSNAQISQRDAAREIGVTPWHLNRVLRGHRASRRILAAIQTLTQKEVAQ